MAMDLRVPPLAGTYGRAGAGKTSDKIRACPRGYFFAGPGQLIPAITEVGYTPKFEEMREVFDLDTLRSKAERVIKADKSITAIVVDDFSMIAARTERVLLEGIGCKPVRDGRQRFGMIKSKAGLLFDEWRNYGLAVLVDCHEKVPEWKVDEDGVELAHTEENRIYAGGPALPGRQSGPEMVKAFDLFLRVIRHESGISLTPDNWPYRYRAGPWGPDGADWETKDRWSVVRPANYGVLPLNLGEILRFVQRRYGPKWTAFQRPPGMEWHEEFVVWAAGAIASGNPESEVLKHLIPRIREKTADPHQIKWILLDFRARVVIEKLHTPEALLAELGVRS